MTPNEKYLFCKDGKIVSVECQSTDGQPYYSTGEIVSCNVDQGLVCDNADNFPGCQHDYMLRYQCEETTCKGNYNPALKQWGLYWIYLVFPSFCHSVTFQMKIVITLFSGTVRPRRLKLDTHVDSGQMYSVYWN